MRISKNPLLPVMALIVIIGGCKHPAKNMESIPANRIIGIYPTELSSMQITDSAYNRHMIENYWNDFRLSDFDHLGICFRSYIELLHRLPSREAVTFLGRLIDKIGRQPQKTYCMFLDLAEECLYDPGSPDYDDGLYLLFVRDALKSNRIDATMRERLGYRYRLMLKNSPGKRASNFSYLTICKKRECLYDLKSRYILFFFNDPDCADCRSLVDGIESDDELQDMIAGGRLALLSVYPGDDEKMWEKSEKEMPRNWINAWDKSGNILKGELYDLRIMPSLYLLNRDKWVILKNPTIDGLKRYMEKSE